jgi:ATPase subunit of ABC transporter with duplicated ATPase domains
MSPAGRASHTLRRASLGQQLSALLQLLLGPSAGTLIVDQPEDDLDNKVLI